MNWKIGNRVVCINNAQPKHVIFPNGVVPGITVGKTYIIIDSKGYPGHVLIQIKDDFGKETFGSAEGFFIELKDHRIKKLDIILL
jgi:hypothetical protein